VCRCRTSCNEAAGFRLAQAQAGLQPECDPDLKLEALARVRSEWQQVSNLSIIHSRLTIQVLSKHGLGDIIQHWLKLHNHARLQHHPSPLLGLLTHLELEAKSLEIQHVSFQKPKCLSVANCSAYLPVPTRPRSGSGHPRGHQDMAGSLEEDYGKRSEITHQDLLSICLFRTKISWILRLWLSMLREQSKKPVMYVCASDRILLAIKLLSIFHSFCSQRTPHVLP
jgi:hypothetical protein